MTFYKHILLALSISGTVLSYGQEDNSYFNLEHATHLKNLKPLLAINVAPITFNSHSSGNIFLGSNLALEISDIKSWISIDGIFQANYLRFDLKNKSTYNFGYNPVQDKIQFNGGIGVSIIFRKEVVEAAKRKKPFPNGITPVKIRRYEARLGLNYSEKHFYKDLEQYNELDSSYYHFSGNYKSRDLILSIGAKARVTRKIDDIKTPSRTSKSRESYFYLDLLIPVTNFPHFIQKYSTNGEDISENDALKYWENTPNVPAGVRIGYVYGQRKNHGGYFRIEGGLYPGKVERVNNALGISLAIGYRFLKSIK